MAKKKRKTPKKPPKLHPGMSTIKPTNPMGAPVGNKNAEKFGTPALRFEAYKAYCEHLAAGFSGDSFHTPCVEPTIQALMKKYPDEFDPEPLRRAKALGRHVWEDIGKQGTIGKIKNFNSTAWKFNVQNRLGWKERSEHGLDKDTRAVFRLKMGKQLGAPPEEDED